MFQLVGPFPHAREWGMGMVRQRRRPQLLPQPTSRRFSFNLGGFERDATWMSNSSSLQQQRKQVLPKAFSTTGSLAGPVGSLSAIPVTATCPEPTCECAPTPTPPMPDGLSIDTVHPLNGTMAAYTQQVVIATGRPDWTSRIEEDGQGESWGALARGLKGLLGRGGKYADPYNNFLITNSSFAPAVATSRNSASAFLFPSFKYFPSIPVDITSAPSTNPQNVDLSMFVRAMLLPRQLHDAHSVLPESKRAEMTRDPELAVRFPNILDIKHSPTILICGHGGRDKRCGVIGPILETEFRRVLQRKGFDTEMGIGDKEDGQGRVNIALISHIGGHKYAGNVIIYIPPRMVTPSAGSSPLAGKGIWYGRVEPKHVEGIVDETILRGSVVADHFRGGIGMNGEVYRL